MFSLMLRKKFIIAFWGWIYERDNEQERTRKKALRNKCV